MPVQTVCRSTWLAMLMIGLVSTPLSAADPQAAPPVDDLRIVIVDGDNFTNNIRQRTAREPIVEVQDKDNRRVPGALVVFTLPGNGPGGTFLNGAKTLAVTTDSEGRAVGTGLRPNSTAGKFQIRVSASHQGHTGHAVIDQENIGTAIAIHHTARWVTIAAVAAGGLAGGIYAATNNGNGAKAASVPSLTPGIGTVGPPR